jgi:hypothetical protein
MRAVREHISAKTTTNTQPNQPTNPAMKKSDLIGHWKLAWVNEDGQPIDPGKDKYLGVLTYTPEGTMHAAVLCLTDAGWPLTGFAPRDRITPMCQFRAGFYFAYCGRYQFRPDRKDPRKGRIIHHVQGATFESPPQNQREAELAEGRSLLILSVTEDVPKPQYWAWRKIVEG